MNSLSLSTVFFKFLYIHLNALFHKTCHAGISFVFLKNSCIQRLTPVHPFGILRIM